MKLYGNTASPFVRKVMVLAHEAGIADRIEMAHRALSPVAPPTDLVADNPLGKIPALVRDDGPALYDSRVICEYLDTLHDGAPFFPMPGVARFTALRRQALCDGMLDAAVVTRYERVLRPEVLRWGEWIEHQKLKISRGLDALLAEVDSLGDAPDIGTITAACTLGYLDFRYGDEDWRPGREPLAAWFETFAARASMQATVPGEVQ
jgi:glutathione S-transferase